MNDNADAINTSASSKSHGQWRGSPAIKNLLFLIAILLP